MSGIDQSIVLILINFSLNFLYHFGGDSTLVPRIASVRD